MPLIHANDKQAVQNDGTIVQSVTLQEKRWSRYPYELANIVEKNRISERDIL